MTVLDYCQTENERVQWDGCENKQHQIHGRHSRGGRDEFVVSTWLINIIYLVCSLTIRALIPMTLKSSCNL